MLDSLGWFELICCNKFEKQMTNLYFLRSLKVPYKMQNFSFIGVKTSGSVDDAGTGSLQLPWSADKNLLCATSSWGWQSFFSPTWKTSCFCWDLGAFVRLYWIKNTGSYHTLINLPIRKVFWRQTPALKKIQQQFTSLCEETTLCLEKPKYFSA